MTSGKKFERLRISSSRKIEELLEEALEGFISLDEDTKDIILGSLMEKCKINEKDKIIIGLLGYKALQVIGWRDEDAVSAKELSEKLGINYSTVRGTLSNLVNQEKIVQRKERGLYAINIQFLDKISKRVINLKEKCMGVD